MVQEKYRHTNKIDYLGDFPGARRERDVVVVELSGVDLHDGIPISSLPNQHGSAGGLRDTVGSTTIANFDVPSARQVMGQVTASDDFRVNLIWRDPNGEDIRSETVGEADSGQWVQFDEIAYSAVVAVEVVPLDGNEMVVEYTLHMT